MTSVDTLAAAIRAAIDQNNDLIARLGTSREQAAEFQRDIGALGVEAKATQAASIADSLEAMQTKVSGITAGLESARAATEAIRTDAADSGAPPGPLPSTSLPPPKPSGTPGYPYDMPHTISWSDLHHVVDGDPDNVRMGGHAHGVGRPGKTEFPEGWDDEKIREALEAVAASPTKVNPDLTGRNFIAEGVHHDVTVRAVVRPDGSIEAGWPVEGPGVRQNPRRR